MFTKLKTLVYTMVATAMLLVPTIAMPLAVHAASTSADIQNGVCQGSNLQFTSTISASACSTIAGGSEGTVNNLIATVINIFSVIVGVICVIMIMVGAFRYVTSGGNDQNVASAKNTIMYAIIGLVIVALAQLVVKFVLHKTVTA